MEIALDLVRGEPFVWQETLAVDPASLERAELVELGEVECRGRVVFTDPGYYLTARLVYEQTVGCTRCLEPVRLPVETEVELLLLVEPSGAPDGASERELEEDELGVLSLPDEKVDTRPILLEQLQLAIPMKALCRPDCKGLCPRCGADLNRGACACGAETDPRWEALAALKDRLGGS